MLTKKKQDFFIFLCVSKIFDKIILNFVWGLIVKLGILATLLCVLPGLSMADSRGEEVRVGVKRASNAAARMPTLTAYTGGGVPSTVNVSKKVTVKDSVADTEKVPDVPEEVPGDDGVGDESGNSTPVVNGNCRDAYRECMDLFCLLDESEGNRCACSSNIEKSKGLIQEIQNIQLEADKLYTEGVEREQLGAKARLVFGESETAKKKSVFSGFDFAAWASGGVDDEEGELGEDLDIGDALYEMAAEQCAAELEACGSKAEMEELLYSRQITADCKAFNLYLNEQKLNAQANKRTAEAAVRKARLEMLDTTNKYNQGECLLAYRACIADKGGCGSNFENCLDADLLGRRASACENVLDQCMAVRDYVLKDWQAESEAILVDAAKYADKYRRQTCLAQIQVCLEDGCSTSTNSACLSDVNVAAGVCPIIDECDSIVPGLKSVVNDKLFYLRTQFCQNDVDACLRDKCGENFTAPECVGKKTSDIVALCPQNMFPSCKTEPQFDIIVQAVLLQMDYQLMQGCVNYFGEQLGKVCGTDMACLPSDSTVESLQKLPESADGIAQLRAQVQANSVAAVDEFFAQFQQDVTVAACMDSEKPKGQKSLGDTVFTSAKMIARIGAENRALRALETKIAELSRQQDLEEAEANCYNTYKVETPDKSAKNYSYVRSVAFEPSLRNCHVCRMQQVCETGGESKATSALKAAAGGLSAGASAGTMISAGWGTAIGGIVGAVGGAIGGAMSGGKKDFCQEIESCEDINM